MHDQLKGSRSTTCITCTPNDFLQAATQPPQLLALNERVKLAEASTCKARLKLLGRAMTRCLLLRFPIRD
jgi:hypothetical protein